MQKEMTAGVMSALLVVATQLFGMALFLLQHQRVVKHKHVSGSGNNNTFIHPHSLATPLKKGANTGPVTAGLGHAGADL